MRPTLFSLLLTVLCAAPAALSAQPGAAPGIPAGPGSRPGFAPGGPPAAPGPGCFDEEAREELALRRLETLSDYLELSAAQRDQIDAIVEEQRRLREADREALRGEAERLRELLASQAPDPAEVGRLVIDLHRGRESLAEQRAAEREQIEALLTPDQLERFEALEAARQMRPPHPRLHHRPGQGWEPPSRDGG